MRAIRLRTEYLTEPLGLGITAPRLYWNADGGLRQTAYQVVARRGGETVWDTGKVASSRMTHVRYEGVPLGSRDRVDWSVVLWDEADVAGPPAESWFELGLLDPADWTAEWITGDYTPERDVRYPVDHFRRDFRVREPVLAARLYITAAGVYEVSLNGEPVSEVRLAPGATDYRHRLHYQTFDVTSLLGEDNVLEVRLADGWYRGSLGAFGVTHVFGRETKLLVQLELTYPDGSTETVSSDDRFRWSDDGPVRFADLQDGEVYDARLSPSYSGQARVTTEAMIPTAADNVMPSEHERFPARLLTTPSGARVLDFGQNLAGFVAFTVSGRAGQRLTLRLGEILDETGEFTQRNFQLRKPVNEFGRDVEILLITGQESEIKGELQPTPKQEIVFTASGGTDHYVTRFAVFGFRYALVETDLDLDPADFGAIAVYSAMEQTGTFVTSHEGINRFLENTRWSMKGNFLDVPTDCPTRERLGWTGDAQVFFDTAAYLMDVGAFFRKWLRDVRDGQLADGKLSAVIPYNGASMLYDTTGSSVGWADAVVLIPYRYWKRYGDESILHDCYDAMRRYAMFMITNAGPIDPEAAADNPHAQYLYEKGVHLGDWLEAAEFRDPSPGRTPMPEEATAYLHYTMTHLAEIATVLGETADADLFAEYAQGAKAAYTHQFLRDGTLDTDRQAKLVRPLALGLADGDVRRRLQDRLVQAVKNRDFHVNTGFLSTPFVLPTLTAAGHPDLAYRMLENEDAPSWLAEVRAGATTVWEDWEGKESRNHYSPGAVCQWLFDTVAGLRVTGENHFTIAPVPGGSLTSARATYTSVYGTVASAWTRTGTDIQLTVTLPPNTTADVRLPNGTEHVVGPGTHEYTA
ncbi:family 78 glycoside hydrolase catalytic domain [Frankia sp. AgB1.9]|uniref:family 78 glycoside hydrolase catalytic domain n=1 Tax=unclassified Frankia TaxID=2632575 RepID=UPI0019339BED|nr:MULTISPECIES: family 78 glycoside hydrolase catalytic domain [unclassified Frankia]MBL7492991.1 family 78 glycoside hydrolase catalytic domain [Frankia sp. AgW1.1]MBL7549595.1 family 78 glycoside hydrolase catalytic domain [Frankia sp. AgB1.9]MBL7620424.1 family 78 glycoside hydrolase catalytic domain [Frankia sp. AgB1.8]